MDYCRYAEIQNEGTDDDAPATTEPGSTDPAAAEPAPTFCTPL